MLHDAATAVISPVNIQKRISKRRNGFISNHGTLLPTVVEAMSGFESDMTSAAPVDNNASLESSASSSRVPKASPANPNTVVLTPLTTSKRISRASTPSTGTGNTKKLTSSRKKASNGKKTGSNP